MQYQMTHNRQKKGEMTYEERCETELMELKEEFRQELPARLNKLLSLVPLAAAGSAKALEEISAESHKLRGTATSLGQPLVGDLLGDVEDSLSTAAEGNIGPTCTWSNVTIFLAHALAIITIGEKPLRKKKSIDHELRQR